MTTDEVWMQARGAGWRQPRETALTDAAEFLGRWGGELDIHDGECGLGKADYETNPNAGHCTCAPSRVVPSRGVA
jgi:hypothetical protein